MTYTDLNEVTDKSSFKQLLFYMNGIKVETDTLTGDLYFNGSKAEIRSYEDAPALYTAYGVVYRTKKPKKAIGARKRKKSLQASYKKYNVSLNFIKG